MDILKYIFIFVSSYFVACFIASKIRSINTDFFAKKFHDILKEKDQNLEISKIWEMIIETEKTYLRKKIESEGNTFFLLKQEFYLSSFFNFICYYTLIIILMFKLNDLIEKFFKFLFL